jgi:hypothetical protein
LVLAGIAGAGALAAAHANHWQASRIVIHLNDEATISVRRTSLEAKKNGWTWRGEIDATGEPAMIMWWTEGRFSGEFTYRGDMYTLKTVTDIGGEVHAFAERSPQRMPTQRAAMHSHDQLDHAISSGKQEASATDSAQEAAARASSATQPDIPPISLVQRRALAAKKIIIDVMVLYTRKVSSKYLDVEADLVAHSIDEANASFVNSDIGNIQLRLAHSQMIDYDESDGEHFNHLYRMVDGMGVFANVRALRDEKRADVVVLIVDDASGCGLTTRVSADAEEAYAVVHHACAALTYSVPHEIGHIIGAGHDASLEHVSPFAYGHGYVNGNKWRDIMSYKGSCDGCPRLAFWSNPTITIKGEAAGTAHADNARVLLEQAERVSKFR